MMPCNSGTGYCRPPASRLQDGNNHDLRLLVGREFVRDDAWHIEQPASCAQMVDRLATSVKNPTNAKEQSNRDSNDLPLHQSLTKERLPNGSIYYMSIVPAGSSSWES
jgi:hypothetical protein